MERFRNHFREIDADVLRQVQRRNGARIELDDVEVVSRIQNPIECTEPVVLGPCAEAIHDVVDRVVMHQLARRRRTERPRPPPRLERRHGRERSTSRVQHRGVPELATHMTLENHLAVGVQIGPRGRQLRIVVYLANTQACVRHRQLEHDRITETRCVEPRLLQRIADVRFGNRKA